MTVRELLRESPDPTVVTVYLEDTIDVLGAVLALIALVLHRVTGSAVPDALASIVIGLLLVLHRLAPDAPQPPAAHQPGGARALRRPAPRRAWRPRPRSAPSRAWRPSTSDRREVLVAADVAMADGLSGAEVALSLARTRAAICTELPVVARLYLTPVVSDP